MILSKLVNALETKVVKCLRCITVNKNVLAELGTAAPLSSAAASAATF